jgi:hypothetical protein
MELYILFEYLGYEAEDVKIRGIVDNEQAAKDWVKTINPKNEPDYEKFELGKITSD